jgi:hypothetical protein
MKLQKMIRMQVMLMGMGAALLLASSAYAQQDMDPTDFAINPGTPRVDTRAVARTAAVPTATQKINSEEAVPASLWNGQATQEEADLTRLTIVDGTMVVILMAGVGLIVLYAMAATRRERRVQISPESAPYTSAS